MTCLSQVWTDVYSEQVSYIETLLSELSVLDLSTTTITLYQDIEPTESELLAAYEDQTGIVSEPPSGTSFTWFNPTTEVIENEYRVVDDIASAISSGTPRSYVEKDRTTDIVFIGEIYALDDTAVASMILDNIPSTYNNLFITCRARGMDAAATVNVNIRANTIATANYASEKTTQDGAAITCVAGVSQTALGDVAGGVGNTTAQPSLYGIGYMFMFNYALSTGFNFGTLTRKATWNGASPVVAASRDHGVAYSVLNQAVLSRPVTRLDFLGPVATWRHGSKFAVYGMK